MYDLDSDGYITKEEMSDILDSMLIMIGDVSPKLIDPKERVDQIFSELDRVSYYIIITINYNFTLPF